MAQFSEIPSSCELSFVGRGLRVESGGARSSKHVNVDGRHAYHKRKRKLGIRSANGDTKTKAAVDSN